MLQLPRKIGFYFIELSVRGEVIEPTGFVELVEFVARLPKASRILDLEHNKKIHLLERHTKNNGVHYCVFKTAKYYHRPPLINRTDAGERESPKLLDEGEAERTHICFREGETDVFLIKEELRAGLSIGMLIKYFKNFSHEFNQSKGSNRKRLPFNINYSIVPHDNFIEQVNGMHRVELGEIYMSKQILGSEILNISDRQTEVRQDIAIEVKPITGGSVRQVIVDAWNKLAGEEHHIKKIKVTGSTPDKIKIILDSEIVKKVETLIVEGSETTGLVDSPTMLRQLGRIIRGEL